MAESTWQAEAEEGDEAAERAAALDAWEAYPPGTVEERRDRYLQKARSEKSFVQKAGSERGALELHEAAAVNDARELRRRLVAGRAVDVDERDRQRQTALHHAVWFGALDCVAVLLSAGWDPNVEDAGGRSPLDFTCCNRYWHFPRTEDARDGIDDRTRQASQLHSCAIILLLLLYGAQPQVKGALANIPLVSFLLGVWDSIASSLRPVNTWEPREVDMLRSWCNFSKALSSAASSNLAPGGAERLKLRQGAMLLRLVLEAWVPLEVLPGKECSLDVAGIYRYEGLHNDRPLYRRAGRQGDGDAVRILCWERGRWELRDEEAEEVAVLLCSLPHDGPAVSSPWRMLTIEGATEAVATYSDSSFLPRVGVGNGRGDDAPFMGLLNPSSGSRMGAQFLEEARCYPAFRTRFFNIVRVATNPVALAAFRRRLEEAKREALKGGHRPRLICGGGDGTASFAIWCIFRALRAEAPPQMDPGRQDEDDEEEFDDTQVREERASTNGFLQGSSAPSRGGDPPAAGPSSCIWPDEELQMFFPALVQMPLGTGNDLAGVLGWGRTITPIHDRAGSREWLSSAVSTRRPVVPFDAWCLTQMGSGGLKVCMCAGVDEKHPDRPRFKMAGASVPFLCLLYFSLGYEAFVAAQVEAHRTESRLLNFIEYGKAIPQAMLGTKRRNVDLTGIKIMVPGKASKSVGGLVPDDRPYFPPPDRSSTGSEYATVGCMNVNSYSGGMWTASDAAKFDDGLLDLFRQRSYLGNVLRRGRAYDTEKHARATITFPASLPGVHCQVDGEARFLFHPQQQEAKVEIRRVMQIPVVLGPESQELPMSSCAGWVVVADRDAPGADAAFIPATYLDECKELCIRHGFGGFCVFRGRAYFREEAGKVLKSKLVAKPNATFYIRDERAEDVKFRFTGPHHEQPAFRAKLDEWVAGKLTRELNATKHEVEELQWRADHYAQGICARSRRAYANFYNSRNRGAGDGAFITFTQCATCHQSCGNWGCKGCRRPFCKKCFEKHKDTAPSIKWMYRDVGVLRSTFAESYEMCLEDAQEQLAELIKDPVERPIRIRIFEKGRQIEEEVCENATLAVNYLKEYQNRDQQKTMQPRTLVSFVQHRNAAVRTAGVLSQIGEERSFTSEEEDGTGSATLQTVHDFLASD